MDRRSPNWSPKYAFFWDFIEIKFLWKKEFEFRCGVVQVLGVEETIVSLLVWVLSSVFSIFCITSFRDCTHGATTRNFIFVTYGYTHYYYYYYYYYYVIWWLQIEEQLWLRDVTMMYKCVIQCTRLQSPQQWRSKPARMPDSGCPEWLLL